MQKLFNIAILCLFFIQAGTAQTNTFLTRDLKLTLSSNGNITELTDLSTNKNYAKDAPSPLLSLLVNKQVLLPGSVQYNARTKLLRIKYPNETVAEVKIISAATHLSFELTGLKTGKPVDAVIWGPYTTSLTGSIGETIGVVQNDEYTVGLLGLNPKTLGGYPWVDNDHMPQLDIFSQENFDVSKPAARWVLYSVEAAKPIADGSTLEAFTRNRNMDREIANWGYPKFMAPKYDDGGLIGSKIALYGTPTATALDRIGEIEIAEGLPHPMIDGEWVKKSKIINSSYLIMDFSEETIDDVLDVTQKAGFNYLYHSDPFEAWGHYPLRKKYFPNGLQGLKNCVSKANSRNIKIGTHTLTNFINTNDPYVTPVPDKRLAKVGYSKLSGSISSTQTEIAVLSDEPFKHVAKSHLKAIQIGNEIIRFGSVSKEAPYILSDCQRGAFGTAASEHAAGAEIAMLLDHAYKVFLGNAGLNKEIAENIADLFNATGIRMLDFDGHEGTHSTGMGTYGEALFAKHWHDRLNEDIKKHFVLGSSRSGHYFWHYYARMNWGEPWYAGFRESQTEYRLQNQAYFRRNYMPRMLGWFRMTSSTTVEDINWLMARSAGYNAGFAFVTDENALAKNGHTEEILGTMKLWEHSRLKGLFSKEQTMRMQGTKTEFRLSKNNGNTLSLAEIFSGKFTHSFKPVQPGEPASSAFEFENPAKEQVLQFIITAPDNAISNITIEIDNYKNIDFPVRMNAGDALKYEGGTRVIHYDKNWQLLKEYPIQSSNLLLKPGKHKLLFNCNFESPGEKPAVKLEVIVEGSPELITDK